MKDSTRVSRHSLRYLVNFLCNPILFAICTSIYNLCLYQWTNLNLLGFILHFLNQIWIAAALACSFYEAMTLSLSVASNAVSSAQAAVVDSGMAGRSAVYNKYVNDPKTLPWGTPALTAESSVYSISTFKMKHLLCKCDFMTRKVLICIEVK
jgi:hypothetical protein